jgi:hypothetical protein
MIPDRMKPTLRVVVVLTLLVAGALVVACTKSTEAEPRPSGTSGSGSGTVTPGETATGPPGTAVYRYTNPGLVATMSLDGDSGTLAIENDTGRDLSPPGFYILDARNGDRVNGQIKNTATIPNGETKTFRVLFGGLGSKDIGLVILLIGHDNYGAFARQ